MSSSVLKGHPFDTVVCACHDYAIEIGHVATELGIDSEYSFVRIRFEAAELSRKGKETDSCVSGELQRHFGNEFRIF